MKQERKNIVRQKNAEERKAILITIVIVLAIALLILAAVLFLPNVTENEKSDELSSDRADNTVSNVSHSEESSLAESRDASQTESQDTSESDISDESNDMSDVSGSDELVHRWVINNLGYTYIYGDIGLEQCSATTATLQRYADTVNSLSSSLPSGVKVYSITVPTHAEFVDIPREIYSADQFFNASQKNVINGINDRLDSRITAVNIYETLREHSDEYLYFRTDINWTPLAAYYAYSEFSSAAGFSSPAFNDYNKEMYTGFLGRFYTATEEPTLAANPDTIEYPLVDPEGNCNLTVYHRGLIYNNYKVVGNSVSAPSNGYNVFLGMEAERYKITTGNSGDKLLIVSDTSAAAFVPYLVSHYSEIHYVNPSYFGDSLKGYVSDNGIAEVLFMNYATNANRFDFTNVLSELGGISG